MKTKIKNAILSGHISLLTMQIHKVRRAGTDPQKGLIFKYITSVQFRLHFLD